jgi:type VI secretion system protein ImpJ
MRVLAPVSWSEGMFLKPHHFQQADLFQDARLTFHLRAFNPFHWGIASLRVDAEALENMIFRVLGCEAVLGDGLALRVPEDAVVEERSFQDEFPPAANALDVYLTVQSLGGEKGAAERFVRESEMRRDLQLRDNEASVEFLVPRAQLVFAVGNADERLAGLQSLRIARVRRTGRQVPRFELVPDYAPAALSLRAAPVLEGTMKEVLERLCAASRTFGQFRRERGPEALGYGVGDLEQLLARATINQYVPAIQHALVNESVHPYFVYGLLAELRGCLTSYFPDEEAWTFPEYDHDDLGTCFGQMAGDVKRLLERLLPQHYVELPLTRKDHQFDTPLEDTIFGRGSVWVLALHGGQGEDALRRRITDAKITSTQDMPQLVNYASNGVPLKFVPQPPAQIPRYAGWSYFEIEVADPRWRRVKEDCSFAFHLVDADPGLEARVFVVLSEKERARR